jgi:hypothetical protein
MAELIDVFKALVSKSGWDKISDEDKIKNFFIINRYMSKKYPEKAQLLNIKVIDKVSSLDLWHYFIKDKPYPNWFWSKSEKTDKPDIPEKDYKLLIQKLKVKSIDLDYLIEHNPDFIKEELKYIKDIEKNK